MSIKSFFDIGPGGKNMNPLLRMMNSWMKGYNHKKYWSRRALVINPGIKMSFGNYIVYTM